jgi:hypothetical protein
MRWQNIVGLDRVQSIVVFFPLRLFGHVTFSCLAHGVRDDYCVVCDEMLATDVRGYVLVFWSWSC